MPSRSSLLALLLTLAPLCHAGTFFAPAGPWPAILASAGHFPSSADTASIFVAPPGTAQSPEWKARLDRGAAIILEGSSPLAFGLGFRPEAEIIPVVHPIDVHNPKLPIIWSQPVEISRYQVPPGAQIFAKDRWTNAPLIAGLHCGAGAILWVAASPGPNGYERFPYLMQALLDLGFGPSYRSSSLWAFFDYSYRTRADPDYLAARWRKAGIAALHVASWHFYDSDPGRDEYLKALIEACHRNAILVYAWVELPHVSERFWNDHPAWREKTAILQDAQLDWRKLMNLQNAECAAAIRAGLTQMMKRFDWDGVNLAELYFESLEGAAEPTRFTPMNDDVRRQFRAEAGWDPIELWGARKDAESLRKFLDFRASLARRMQEEWLAVAESFRQFRPDLDIVLTHVDDRFDTGMKDSIGADAARVLPLLDTHAFSFLIEDPATVWNLGPQRYPEIAKRYRPLTPHLDRLAIDLNIVDRYQDVYPTKQQTGAELFELVHTAASVFPRVALYFENSLLPPDLPLLAAASAVVTQFSTDHGRVSIDSSQDVELNWTAVGARVDGKPWPAVARSTVHLPPGPHVVEAAPKREALTLIDLNGKLLSASAGSGNRLAFEYSSDSRAIARFDHRPARLEMDGRPFPVSCAPAGPCAVLLARGTHKVTAAD
ncbi:MAG TPA: hypothetical protein VG297_00480 [Bryobacteraceae bacterium]|jgi:hypothetical protein|nr:hypothetical protein [Bryobacteraceae bacterium]